MQQIKKIKNAFIALVFTLLLISTAKADLLTSWNFNTNFSDSSGNNYNATSKTTGAKLSTAEGTGGALKLTGSKDYVKFPQINVEDKFTVMAWVKPTQSPQTWARVIESHFWSGFYLGTNDSNPRKWMFSINGTFNLMPTPVIIGEWQHIAGTYDGTTAKLYVNGQLVGSANQPNPSTPNDTITIGRQVDETYDWSLVGIIDEVRIYTDTASPEMIKHIYETCTTHKVGDFNGDCLVNMEDFIVIAESWLECGLFNCD